MKSFAVVLLALSSGVVSHLVDDIHQAVGARGLEGRGLVGGKKTKSIIPNKTVTTKKVVTSTKKATSASSSQYPVIPITIPGGGFESQVIVGSVVNVANAVTTAVIECADGSDPEYCDIDPPLTLTHNPSLLQFAYNDHNTYSAWVTCQFAATGGACVATEIGQVKDFVTNTGPETATMTQATTTMWSEAVEPTDLIAVRVTVTAGMTSGLGTQAATAAASGATTRASTTGSANGAGALANDVKILAPGAVAAGLMGLAAVWL